MKVVDGDEGLKKGLRLNLESNIFDPSIDASRPGTTFCKYKYMLREGIHVSS